MNAKVNYYIRQFNGLYDGDNWTGETFLGKLNSLDEETAFKQPHPGSHSVAEILWHSIYWRTVFIKRIQGDNEYVERTEKEQNFLPPETLKKKGWNGLLSDLKKSQEEIINLLSTITDEALETEYKPGFNKEYLVEGLVQHDYYHLGQIGLVISILKNKEKFEPWIQ